MLSRERASETVVQLEREREREVSFPFFSPWFLHTKAMKRRPVEYCRTSGNPWGRGRGRGDWRGPWSNFATQWDDFPEILHEILHEAKGPQAYPWDRNCEPSSVDHNGVFYMAFEDFIARFSTLHVCRLFPDDKFRQYKVHGKWAGKTAHRRRQGYLRIVFSRWDFFWRVFRVSKGDTLEEESRTRRVYKRRPRNLFKNWDNERVP